MSEGVAADSAGPGRLEVGLRGEARELLGEAGQRGGVVLPVGAGEVAGGMGGVGREGGSGTFIGVSQRCHQ